MKKLLTMASLLVVASLMLTACGGGGSTATDLLGAIKERGYILISTDPNYEPQSFLNTEGSRPSDTKCPSDALTTAEMQGFDVDVAIAVGDALGVETCFATPGWDTLTAGNWADKWDMSVGSMTITTDRQKVLDFSVPYYYTPAVVAVLGDSEFQALEDLSGQAICAGVSTTYETWLNGGEIGLPASSIYAKPPSGITVVPLESDQECAQALAAGRTDFAAYSTSATVVNANIAAGIPVRVLGSAVYSEDLAAAFDKSSTLPTASLIAEVNKIFEAMHGDGRLTELSMKWFSEDLTQAPNK
ncbi:MAG TPA: transporter substrate-binding domain-containing protein [Anaerolineales bacterium]|nr:transporter substrate-binding domain-containing protein [Anaerolineales bacterium]HMV97125.1 transporter substrate-binding domain-containing protein [Anaerolineales bacterium]HMX18029.1 transporter substrate-binding domain-containing protein [Anaerolineales bacterium]HMX73414.1 transporter substrate-binding domain-containing protein [Anaerolineales bacterium]HMZ42056.1 transporter substrate-binding domain-containing protein [Anaerolineales bacterium]